MVTKVLKVQPDYEPCPDDLWRELKFETYKVGDRELYRMGGLRRIDGVIMKRRVAKPGYYKIRSSNLEANIQPLDYPEPKHTNQPLIVAFGMGTDSLGMLIAMRNRGIVPDVVQWADTGSERLYTYRYVSIIQDWLKKNGFPPLLVVRKRCPQAGHRSLYEQLWNTEQLPSPAFHRNHSCSAKWKLEPQRDYHSFVPWLHSQEARTAIGFSQEETSRRIHGVAEAVGFSDEERSRRSYQVKDDSGYVTYYPLQEWGITRENCVKLIMDEGLPLPGKSACFMCLSGETEVLTRQGLRPIRELSGKEPELLIPVENGNYKDGETGSRQYQTQGAWRQVPVRPFGFQKLWRVNLVRKESTKTILATPEHRWILDSGEVVLTKDLVADQKLAYCVPPEEGPSNYPKAWKVKSVVATNREEQVYCAVVEGAQRFTLADQLVTGNCPMCQRSEIKVMREDERQAAYALEDRAEAGGKLKKIIGLRKGINEKWSEWMDREDPAADAKEVVGLRSELDD